MKSNRLLLLIALLIFASCDKDEEEDNGVSVSISQQGLSDGKLALNNEAIFTANVGGLSSTSGLTYRWSLVTERGELSDGTNNLPNPTILGNTIRCIGRTPGTEEIRVEVLDNANNVLASNSLEFEIVSSVEPIDYGCFDQPKIFFHRGSSAYVCNFDGSAQEYIGISGGTSFDISPNGEWFAWNDDTSLGWEMKVVRCDLTEETTIEGPWDLDFIPKFSLNNDKLYFIRPHPNSEPYGGNSGSNPPELVSYDLESGELEYLTTFYQENKGVDYFDLNPVTGEIAFFLGRQEQMAGGIWQTVEVTLEIMNPENGFYQTFAVLPLAGYTNMHFSPDGSGIIFSGNTGQGKGIYRMDLIEGSQPMLLFADPSPGTVAPLYPHYYNGGERIVWGGQENGTTSLNLWTIDANGNDFQQLTNIPQQVFLQGVLE